MNKKNIAFIIVLGCILFACSSDKVINPRKMDCKPVIYPDYCNVTVPLNIAPLNFGLLIDNYECIHVLFQGSKGCELEAVGKQCIDIDAESWKKMLAQTVNDSLTVTVSIKKKESWFQYKPFAIYVKDAPIDYGVVYRLIAPGYQVYSKMGIYQRSLSDYKQKALFENSQVTNSCVNCHTFCNGSPQIQSVHIRGRDGATVLVRNGNTKTYNSRTDKTLASAVYPYWHPSGRYIAYSTNLVHQMFHTTAVDLMETFDMNSDLYVYDTEKNEILLNGTTQTTDYFETNPAFSPDGNTLYFCRALRKDLPRQVKQMQYDLCAVAFNPQTGKIGEKIDTLICASAQGRSISLPRPSPDGRFIVYAQTNYGCFPLYHQESDLYILDLKTGKARPMSRANSSKADAYHNWSSNGRWMVMGSRREDGMHTRPYFVYVDKDGHESKPFLMPQENPKEYYRELMMSYNCLEFVTGPVSFDAKQVATRLYSHGNEQMKAKQQ